MAIPKNKIELLSAINYTYEKLVKDLETIPPEITREKNLEGHVKETMMSVSDLISYLIGWGQLVIKWNQKIKDKEPVDFPETGYKWTELGLLAQSFYREYDDWSYEELLEKFDETAQSIMDIVENASDEDLYKELWHKNYTMGRMIQLNTSSPYRNARSRVRKLKSTEKIQT